MYGLYRDGRIIGYASVSEETDGAFEIHNLAVLPECRHKGDGWKVLEYCINEIKNLGGGKAVISIIEENDVLKKWYTAHGFVPTGTRKYEHLPFTSGYMELVLR